eukprot:scaffold138681_cov28-Tisochrysis_lutea.AAC.4
MAFLSTRASNPSTRAPRPQRARVHVSATPTVFSLCRCITDQTLPRTPCNAAAETENGSRRRQGPPGERESPPAASADVNCPRRQQLTLTSMPGRAGGSRARTRGQPCGTPSTSGRRPLPTRQSSSPPAPAPAPDRRRPLGRSRGCPRSACYSCPRSRSRCRLNEEDAPLQRSRLPARGTSHLQVAGRREDYPALDNVVDDQVAQRADRRRHEAPLPICGDWHSLLYKRVGIVPPTYTLVAELRQCGFRFARIGGCAEERVGDESAGDAATCTGSAKRTPRSDELTWGLRTCSCALGLVLPSLKLARSLSRPVIPAAGSAWPALALMLPNESTSSVAPLAITAARDLVSMGSPSVVPVPCASTLLSCAGSRAASASAACRSACCAKPLGAVREALLPSCRTQLPSRRVCMSAASVRPAATGLTEMDMAQQASPRTYPSARWSKVWQRPFADSIPAMANVRWQSGSNIMLTPSTKPSWLSRCCRARRAPWLATSAAEQAVSYDMQGPCSPKAYETRPEATEWLLPVAQ